MAFLMDHCSFDSKLNAVTIISHQQTIATSIVVVEPYEEGKQLTTDSVTSGVVDHNQIALIQALKTLL
jgi:hypothetical protein